jgi:hypothetical protein
MGDRVGIATRETVGVGEGEVCGQATRITNRNKRKNILVKPVCFIQVWLLLKRILNTVRSQIIINGIVYFIEYWGSFVISY